MIPYISAPRAKEDSYYDVFSIVSPLFPEDKTFSRGCIVFNINADEMLKKHTSLLDTKNKHFYIYSKSHRFS